MTAFFQPCTICICLGGTFTSSKVHKVLQNFRNSSQFQVNRSLLLIAIKNLSEEPKINIPNWLQKTSLTLNSLGGCSLWSGGKSDDYILKHEYLPVKKCYTYAYACNLKHLFDTEKMKKPSIFLQLERTHKNVILHYKVRKEEPRMTEDKTSNNT